MEEPQTAQQAEPQGYYEDPYQHRVDVPAPTADLQTEEALEPGDAAAEQLGQRDADDLVGPFTCTLLDRAARQILCACAHLLPAASSF